MLKWGGHAGVLESQENKDVPFKWSILNWPSSHLPPPPGSKSEWWSWSWRRQEGWQGKSRARGIRDVSKRGGRHRSQLSSWGFMNLKMQNKWRCSYLTSLAYRESQYLLHGFKKIIDLSSRYLWIKDFKCVKGRSILIPAGQRRPTRLHLWTRHPRSHAQRGKHSVLGLTCGHFQTPGGKEKK